MRTIAEVTTDEMSLLIHQAWRPLRSLDSAVAMTAGRENATDGSTADEYGLEPNAFSVSREGISIW